jgi:hypothetical protein
MLLLLGRYNLQWCVTHLRWRHVDVTCHACNCLLHIHAYLTCNVHHSRGAPARIRMHKCACQCICIYACMPAVGRSQAGSGSRLGALGDHQRGHPTLLDPANTMIKHTPA